MGLCGGNVIWIGSDGSKGMCRMGSVEISWSCWIVLVCCCCGFILLVMWRKWRLILASFCNLVAHARCKLIFSAFSRCNSNNWNCLNGSKLGSRSIPWKLDWGGSCDGGFCGSCWWNLSDGGLSPSRIAPVSKLWIRSPSRILESALGSYWGRVERERSFRPKGSTRSKSGVQLGCVLALFGALSPPSLSPK